MAEVSDWLLKKIERLEDEVADKGGKPWRGEVLYKGEVMWILDADTEDDLEKKAWSILPLARPMASEDDDDPDADMVTFVPLE